MEGGRERLAQGRSIIIFPQTTRSLGFDPKLFNSIGVKLARRAGVPVVPIALKTDAWGVGKLIKDFGKIHPEKTVLVDFNKPDSRKREGSKTTFEFLGFTHYYGKSRNGNWTIKRKTAANRLARSMKAIWVWCRKNRHWSVPEQWQILCSKLRGHYNYYGIRCNYKALEVVYRHTRRAWKIWLSRRTSKGNISWEKFEKKILTPFPLPMPKIVHNV